MNSTNNCSIIKKDIAALAGRWPVYNWDRPCVFIDSSTFVVALDDTEKSGELDNEELENYKYLQLAFFKADAEVHTNKYNHRWMEPYLKIKCDAFSPDKYGEVRRCGSYHNR